MESKDKDHQHKLEIMQKEHENELTHKESEFENTAKYKTVGSIATGLLATCLVELWKFRK